MDPPTLSLARTKALLPYGMAGFAAPTTALNGGSPPRQAAGRAFGKRRGRLQACLALGVLLSLAGLLEAGLLALDDAGVTTQVTGLLQGGAVVLGVDLVQ